MEWTMADPVQNARILDQFARQAQSYAALVSKHSRDPSLPIFLDAVKPTVAQRMLDVGCGTGRFAVSIAPLFGHVIGVDLTPAMLNQARALQAESNVSNITWQEADVTSLPFAEGEFDVVTCKAMLHHVMSPAAVLSEMRRVCRPGGYVVAADMMPKPEKCAATNAIEILRDPSHVQCVTGDQMRTISADLGLVEVATHSHETRIPLEAVLQTSFPAEGMLERVRRLYHLDAKYGADTFGLGARFDGEEVLLAYPMTMMVWRREA
jgi:2-polyprenyl-3-methyl-5-hydroxy-6-metoxy-1,4-benzoquinol methylase